VTKRYCSDDQGNVNGKYKMGSFNSFRREVDSENNYIWWEKRGKNEGLERTHVSIKMPGTRTRTRKITRTRTKTITLTRALR
jgi:hypothetical protein